ncbi:MAG: AAA family ATPase, partial [Miltoncostaeaceae bacterium]
VPLSPTGDTPANRRGGGPALRTRCLADIDEERVSWYWPRRLPWGEVVVMAGDGAVGKSTLAALIAAGVTRGEAPRGGTIDGPRGVLVVSPEEKSSVVVRPRLRLLGADLNRVHDLDPDGAGLSLPRDEHQLEGVVAELGIGLVIIDPASTVMDEDLNTNREEHIRRFLVPLQRIAHAHGALVLVLAHLNKATGADSGQRMMGGAAWRNAPRLVLLVGAPPGQDPRETPERFMLVEKSNIGSYPHALAFRLEPHPDDPERVHPVLGAEVAGISAHHLVGPLVDEEERTATDDAAAWLRTALADGPRPAREVQKEAAENGIPEKPLRTARQRLGIVPRKDGFGPGAPWVWTLPDDEVEAA